MFGEDPLRGCEDERVEAVTCQVQYLWVFREQVEQVAPTFCGLDLGRSVAASVRDFGCPHQVAMRQALLLVHKMAMVGKDISGFFEVHFS
jgi:hypothetical protein